MRNINMKRFWRTLRWYVSENKKNMIAWFAGVALGYMLVQTMLVWMTNGKIQGIESNGIINPYLLSVAAMTTVCYVCTFIAIMVACSCIFNPLKTKKKRIAFFMLPATNLERFLTVCAYGVIIIPVGIVLAAIVGDSLRALFFCILGEQWASGISGLIQFTGEDNPSLTELITKNIESDLLFAWICSLFVLGGTLLRRHSFAIVSASLIAVVSLGSWCITKLFPDLNIDWEQMFILKYYSDYIVSIALIAFIVLNFWLSYRLFKRFQIITSKWKNL